MAASTSEQLFKELDDVIRAADVDYQKALDITNKILKDAPKDKEATQVKVICLVQLGKFNEGLSAIEASGSAAEYAFEQAYCLYKTRQHSEALKILKSIPDPLPVRALHLLAQVHYRLENWEDAIKIFQELVQKVSSTEVKTNLNAALASAGKGVVGLKLVAENKALLQESHEYAYNAACLALADGDHQSALQYLQQSIDTCKATYGADEYTEEEIEDELAIVRTQLGFVKQKLKQENEAQELYNQVLKSKPSDQAVVAVASNNVVTLQKDQSFDSEKKLKHTISEEAEQKLSEWQKKIAAFNRCLLQLKLKKTKEFKEMVQTLQEKYPDSSHPVLLSASALIREKKNSEAQALLEEYASKHPTQDNLLVQLSLAQLRLISGNVTEAITALESIEQLKHKPALVAGLVTLHEQRGNITAASAVFDAALQYWDNRRTSVKDARSASVYLLLAREAANFKLKYKLYREAAATYERVVKQFPDDQELLANYIVALSYSDPVEAEKNLSKIPLKGLASIDAESLENLPIYKAASATAASATLPEGTPAPAVVRKGRNSEKKKAKKKNKKKKKLGKTYDPNAKPDPERWLPKHERSYYKRRKRRNEPERLGRGSAQGVVDRTAGAPVAGITPAPKAGEPKPSTPPPKAAPKQEPPKATPPKNSGGQKKAGGRRRR